MSSKGITPLLIIVLVLCLVVLGIGLFNYYNNRRFGIGEPSCTPSNSSDPTFCTKDSDCGPVCDSWCGNINYYCGKTINCPAILRSLNPIRCVCQNNNCTKV